MADIVLIAAGISLDAAGVMIVFGAMMPRIRAGTLVRLCAIIAPVQAAVLFAGDCLHYLFPGLENYSRSLVMTGWIVLAAFIFLGLGICMFIKASRRQVIYEYRREYLETKVIVVTAMALSVDALFAGIGMGFMNVELAEELAAVLAASVAAVIGGVYLGYHWGVEQRGKAYAASGVMLCFAGVEMLVRYLL